MGTCPGPLERRDLKHNYLASSFLLRVRKRLMPWELQRWFAAVIKSLIPSISAFAKGPDPLWKGKGWPPPNKNAVGWKSQKHQSAFSFANIKDQPKCARTFDSKWFPVRLLTLLSQQHWIENTLLEFPVLACTFSPPRLIKGGEACSICRVYGVFHARTMQGFPSAQIPIVLSAPCIGTGAPKTLWGSDKHSTPPTWLSDEFVGGHNYWQTTWCDDSHDFLRLSTVCTNMHKLFAGKSAVGGSVTHSWHSRWLMEIVHLRRNLVGKIWMNAWKKRESRFWKNRLFVFWVGKVVASQYLYIIIYYI